MCGILLLLSACAGGGTPTPILPRPNATDTPTPAVTSTPTSTPTPLPTPTPTTLLVAILNKRLTRAELVEVLQREGTLTVAGWNYAAKDAMVEQFQAWVKKEYGVEVTLQYISDLAPAAYLGSLDAARQTKTAAPYDVVAVEENYFAAARRNDAVAEMFPSDLLGNAGQVAEALHSEPYAIAFQSASTVAPIFHNAVVGEWFHDWQDLADARLKRRIALPKPEGKLAGVFLLGVANALGKDYKNPAQMRAAIETVCTQIIPNAYTFTNNLNELQQLLRENRIDVAVSWNLLARLERFSDAAGTQDIAYRPMASGQPALNGYAWIPRGTAHPALAQLFINWRLSRDGQLPGEAWGISNLAWGEYHEGLLGASYADAIPATFKENYFSIYPTVEQIQNLYKPIDWNYYATQEEAWMEQYAACIK